MTAYFPLAYRWFIVKELTNLEPWYFSDDKASVQLPPDWSKSEFAIQEFKTETGADFDVYLFARRQDCDDYAFFVVRDGKIEDRVVLIHLSFAKKLEVKSPLRYEQNYPTFMRWIRNHVIVDVEEWMSEVDLFDD